MANAKSSKKASTTKSPSRDGTKTLSEAAVRVVKPEPMLQPLRIPLRAPRALSLTIAAPRFRHPDNNATVPANDDVLVIVTTNRPDYEYRLDMRDSTSMVDVGTVDLGLPSEYGGVGVFLLTLSGLVAGHAYRFRVYVSPDSGSTPPNLDDILDLNAA